MPTQIPAIGRCGWHAREGHRRARGGPARPLRSRRGRPRRSAPAAPRARPLRRWSRRGRRRHGRARGGERAEIPGPAAIATLSTPSPVTTERSVSDTEPGHAAPSSSGSQPRRDDCLPERLPEGTAASDVVIVGRRARRGRCTGFVARRSSACSRSDTASAPTRSPANSMRVGVRGARGRPATRASSIGRTASRTRDTSRAPSASESARPSAAWTSSTV